MAALRGTNLTLKFALEVAALAAFSYWGATVASGAGAVALAIAAPLLVAVLWGRLAAPRAARRLRLGLRVPFELTVFGLAAAALLNASTGAAVAFAGVVVVNAALLSALGQWEA